MVCDVLKFAVDVESLDDYLSNTVCLPVNISLSINESFITENTSACSQGKVLCIIFVYFDLLLLLLLSASPYSGSPQRDSNLHFTRSTSSPSLAPTLSMSSLTKSIHLLLGLPLFLLPGTAISIILFPT